MYNYIWNSSLLLAKQIENNIIDVKGKRVLELGAGAGLPSIISCLNNAKEVFLLLFYKYINYIIYNQYLLYYFIC